MEIFMTFLITSPLLSKLEPEIRKVAEKIRDAILRKQPIVIRHHNDTDGYTAGIALEQAILPLVQDKHNRERDVYLYYTRSPSTAPYYSLNDATRDITNFLNNKARFETKPPLIIILDNGSSEQDIPAIRKVKIYGASVIVIDHHPYAEEIDAIAEAHLNPHKVHSIYDYSAGMLCAEIAHLLERKNGHIKHCFEFIAAVSAKADRIQSEEAKMYIEKAKQKHNITEEGIKQVAECIDHEAFILGQTESRKITHDLLNPESEEHKPLVALLTEETKRKFEKQLFSTLHYAKIEDQGNKIIAKIDVEQIKQKNEYPRAGKIVGALQDNLISNKRYNKELKPVISLGVSNDSISFRCSRTLTKFDVNEIIKMIGQELPHTQISGGGHPFAGSIKFIEASRQEVLKIVDGYIKKI